MKSKSEYAEEAARIVLERGVTHGGYMDETGKVCALGALSCAVFTIKDTRGRLGLPYDSVEYDAYTDLSMAANAKVGNVAAWNDGNFDHEPKTKEQVHDLWMGVAKDLRERGE